MDAEFDREHKAEIYSNGTEKNPRVRWLRHFELNVVCGDIGGKRVLDLPCGHGWHAYRLASRTPAPQRIIAIDVSEKMIALAKIIHSHPRINYQVRDAANIGAIGTFDIVFSAYLLCYAETIAQLRKFVREIARNVTVGGQLWALTINGDFDFTNNVGLREYRLQLEKCGDRHAMFRNFLETDCRQCNFESRVVLWPKHEIEAVLTQFGFGSIDWIPLRLVGNEPADERKFAARYTEIGPEIGLRATKITQLQKL